MSDRSPTAWRARHDAFARAAHDLRRLAPEGHRRLAPPLAALDAALCVHMEHEEAELMPRYAEVAPSEGPGSVAALLRDHGLIRDHLDALQQPLDPVDLADRLARFEGLLEHHDDREARTFLPALEALGQRISLEEAPLAPVDLAALDAPLPPPSTELGDIARALAADAPWPHPLPAVTGKLARHRARCADALARRAAAGDLPTRRDALLEAYDALARWRWMHAALGGQSASGSGTSSPSRTTT